MTRYFCDKCDMESEKLYALAVPNLNTPTPFKFELCARCITRLSDWLRPDPKDAAGR